MDTIKFFNKPEQKPEQKPNNFKPLKPYLLKRLYPTGYDEYRAKVVIASSAKAARAIANKRTGDEGPIWNNSQLVACVEIKMNNPMVVLADFNAG